MVKKDLAEAAFALELTRDLFNTHHELLSTLSLTLDCVDFSPAAGPSSAGSPETGGDQAAAGCLLMTLYC